MGNNMTTNSQAIYLSSQIASMYFNSTHFSPRMCCCLSSYHSSTSFILAVTFDTIVSTFFMKPEVVNLSADLCTSTRFKWSKISFFGCSTVSEAA